MTMKKVITLKITLYTPTAKWREKDKMDNIIRPGSDKGKERTIEKSRPKLNIYSNIVNEIRSQNYTQDNVEDAANKLLEVQNNVDPPIKIIDICQNLGFSVYQQELPEDICGYIMINGELKDNFDTDKIISVNSNESNKRRRFTVAHELGHYLFDFDPNESIQYFDMFEIDHLNGDWQEDRANRFAAELLMPKTAIKSKYYELKGEGKNLYDVVQRISDYFLVPPKAVEVRLKKELQLA